MVKELEDRLDKLVGLKGQELDNAKKLIIAQKDSIPVTKKLRQERLIELAELRKKVKGDRELLREIDNQSKSLKNVNKAYDDQVSRLRKVGSSLMGFGKAAAAGEGSISAFTDNLRGFNAIANSIVNLGNRLDTNIETFRGLAETGASFGQSIVELRRASADAALPLDDFAALVRDNAVNLAALYGSTTEGAKRVAQLAAGFREANINALAPLGFTIDEINDTLLQNLERQRRTFNFEGRADKSNMASALAYAQQLDRLAKLTGVQRRELQAQVDQQMSNERFQAMLAGTTRETGQRLETFAATIGAISPELAEGFQDLIANAGVPVTEAALALVQNMPEARFAVQNLISGLTTAEGALTSVRDASVRSQDRFRKATVTGQVEFLRLQSGIIKLGSTALDVNAVMAEQAAMTPELTQGLTTFQNATKVLSSQFQRIETELLAAFGPALGGLAQATQGLMGGVAKMVGMIAQIPALTAPLILGGIVGIYLFDKVAQAGIITAGTYSALRLWGPMGPMGAGQGGVLGRIGKTAGKVGKFGATRILPAAGAALGVGSSLMMMSSKDEETRKKGKWGLGGAMAGAAMGAAIGSVIPGLGTVVGGLIGAGLGSMGGQAVGSRQIGTMNATGKAFEPVTRNSTVHSGERVLSKLEAANVSQFDTKPLEKIMSSAVAELTNTGRDNKNILRVLNTQVAIQDRTRKATEDGIRVQRNATGTYLTT